MRRLAVIICAVAAALAAPGFAHANHWRAGACGLPAGPPLSVEYAEVAVPAAIRTELFTAVRPPLVLATSQAHVAEELRAAGARTVFWHMRLGDLVGTTAAPADPATIEATADRLVLRAARETGCATPVIALNELHGGWVATPWSDTNLGYRLNVLALLRRMHALGAHPFLMLPTSPPPAVSTEEVNAWWRDVSAVSDLVLEMHFNGRSVAGDGALVGSRRRRTAMRRALDRMVAAGVPPARLGLLHGFQSGRGKGGREGLAIDRWLQVVKWETLAAHEVLAEHTTDGAPVGSDWSWGWGEFPTISALDPDKPLAACTYLWARDPAACDAPERATAWGVPFNASRTEGQLLLAPGIHCSGTRGSVPSAAVDQLAAVRTAAGTPLGRPAALTALFHRLTAVAAARVRPGEVAAAETALVGRRFGGDRALYVQALGGRGANEEQAREAIADQLRRRRITKRLRRGVTYRSWALAAERRLLPGLTCLRDELPAVGIVDLASTLPFLRLPPATATVASR